MMNSNYNDDEDAYGGANPFRSGGGGGGSQDLLGTENNYMQPQQQQQQQYSPQLQHMSGMMQPNYSGMPQQQQQYPQSFPSQQQYGMHQQQQQHYAPDPVTGMTGSVPSSPPPHSAPAPDPTQYLSGSMNTGNVNTGQVNGDDGSAASLFSWRRYAGCFRMDSYKRYFDLDTADFIERFMASLTSFWQPDYFRVSVVGDAPSLSEQDINYANYANNNNPQGGGGEGGADPNSSNEAGGAARPRKGPDLYGPFWIGATLMFMLAVTSNLHAYMRLAAKAKSHSSHSSHSSASHNGGGGSGSSSNSIPSGGSGYDGGGGDASGGGGSGGGTVSTNAPTPMPVSVTTLAPTPFSSAEASDEGDDDGSNSTVRLLMTLVEGVVQGAMEEEAFGTADSFYPISMDELDSTTRMQRFLSGSSTSPIEALNEFEYDLHHLLRAMTVVSIFAYGLPTGFWFATRILGLATGLTWSMWMCCYGYSLVPYLAATLVAWLPAEFLDWVSLAAASAMSGLLVVRNVSAPLLAQDSGSNPKASPIILSILGTHLLFFLTLKFAFYP